jgi:hypothetical protein
MLKTKKRRNDNIFVSKIGYGSTGPVNQAKI